MSKREVIIITGSSGFVGKALAGRLAKNFDIACLDRKEPPELPVGARFIRLDLTSEEGVNDALDQVRTEFGSRIASVIHLAAYFDLTGEPDPKYEAVTVRGTERLLRALKSFEVEQFILFSTMLVHKAARPGETINEDRRLEKKLPYRASKIETEQLIHEQRGTIPVVYLRPAGIYDDQGSNPFLAHQIARVYERSPSSHVYPGDLKAGQSFVHIDDMTCAVEKLVDRRRDLPEELPLLIGESEAIGYGELQREIGQLTHGEDWRTRQVPRGLAKPGVWLEDNALREDSFIKPWMVDIADDHYAIDARRARELLDWKPRRSLRQTLPQMISALKADPPGWYEANKLDAARVASAGASDEAPPDEHEMQEHMHQMHQMQMRMLWVHYLVIGLGAWLITSPFQFGLFDPAAVDTVRNVTVKRGLWDAELRSSLLGWNNIICGFLLILFGSLTLSERFKSWQWGTCVVGLWLMFAPILFWTPSAAVYANDTAVGALAIALSVLIPMMPGMSHEGMMDEGTVPPGWSYNPSTWLQRLPIIALGFLGFLIARYLAAYQFGHIGAVLDPVFPGREDLNGTEDVISSDVSHAFPISDAAFGGYAYMLETLMGCMGSAKRWRTMPWMVTFFFILVVPLGAVSIGFIIIQPIMIGTYCTLCLIQALAMLIMIPFAIDEVVAMGQYMLRSMRAGRPFWRTFFQGGPDEGAKKPDGTGFDAPVPKQLRAAATGITLPWTLLASCAVGVWLMFSRLVFGTSGALADSDHLLGALVVTVAVTAMAEVARALRFLIVLFGLWLIASPWLLADGLATTGSWNSIVAGIVAIGLSLPRGRRSNENYGGWNAWIF